jgi:hypothetical protein
MQTLVVNRQCRICKCEKLVEQTIQEQRQRWVCAADRKREMARLRKIG